MKKGTAPLIGPRVPFGGTLAVTGQFSNPLEDNLENIYTLIGADLGVRALDLFALSLGFQPVSWIRGADQAWAFTWNSAYLELEATIPVTFRRVQQYPRSWKGADRVAWQKAREDATQEAYQRQFHGPPDEAKSDD